MSSIIEGYNYDIFISYRQKDNKGDRWVSEFVEALKTELESTFKEEISVYFDANPHDGLLETHDVDESLKEKLNCLIFIPIISRTYCDPRSFAWEHEFKAFVEMASKDQFGLKVKLPGGNIASRVLPVQIHDLDAHDKKLCETVLGGVMRGIEFIYKEPGVDRPLTAKDNEEKNLNKSNYRNQINKIALAIKEIVSAIKHKEQKPELTYSEISVSPIMKRKYNRIKILTISLLVLILMITGIQFIPKLFKPSVVTEKSVAVLPFTNLSNDPEQEYFSDGVVEAILNHLFKVGELKVISSTSSKRYKNSKLSIRDIGRELGVSAILEGSVQKVGNNVRITAQLIDTRTDAHLWSEIYDKDLSDIFSIQSEVAQNVARELKAALTDEEKELMMKNATDNMEAYNLYLQGRFYWNQRTKVGLKKSVEYFEKAIATDPDYALAYAGLADSYFIQAYWGWIPWKEGTAKSREIVLHSLELNKNLAEAHTVLGSLLHYRDWNWEESGKELNLAIKLNSNYVTAHQYYAELLDNLGQNSEARKHIDIALKIDPFLPVLHAVSSSCFYDDGRLEESLKECYRLIELDPEYYFGYPYWRMFYIYARKSENVKAVEALTKAMMRDSLNMKAIDKINEVYAKSGINGLWTWLIEIELEKSNPSPLKLAHRYSKTGKKDEAIYWLEKAYSNPPPEFPRFFNDPDFDILHSESGYKVIIEKMGLSRYH